MLRFLRRGQRWLMAVVIGAVGFVFALFIGVGAPLRRFGGHDDIVVGVGPYLFGPAEFERERARWEDQYRQALGDHFDARAVAQHLDSAAVEQLADRALLALEAEDLGLAVSKPEIERAVRPNFAREGGQVDRDAFRRWVDYEYGSETAFVRDQRLELLARKLVRLAATQAHVSEGEARDAVRRRLESIGIVFAVVEGTRAPEAIPAEQVASALDARDAELRALYDQRRQHYDVPEQVRARHILIKVPSDADPDTVAAAERKARDTLARLRAGEDFAKVAGETSDDAG